MPNEPIIYLRWQDRYTRRWFVVGRLRLVNSLYEFVYTQGYREAQQVAAMQPISGFPDTSIKYLSESLFPIFQNRLMSQNREEHSGQLKRLGLQPHTNDPLLILARSGGGKVTDPFDVIPAPMELISEGRRTYAVEFFLHGLRYMPQGSQEASEKVQPGSRLFLLRDLQNPKDSNALMLKDENNHLFGYVPRYYSPDVLSIVETEGPASIEVTIRHLNPSSAPPSERMFCRLTATWPKDFKPFRAPEYQSLLSSDDDQPWSRIAS